MEYVKNILINTLLWVVYTFCIFCFYSTIITNTVPNISRYKDFEGGFYFFFLSLTEGHISEMRKTQVRVLEVFSFNVVELTFGGVTSTQFLVHLDILSVLLTIRGHLYIFLYFRLLDLTIVLKVT